MSTFKVVNIKVNLGYTRSCLLYKKKGGRCGGGKVKKEKNVPYFLYPFFSCFQALAMTNKTAMNTAEQSPCDMSVP